MCQYNSDTIYTISVKDQARTPCIYNSVAYVVSFIVDINFNALHVCIKIPCTVDCIH